MPFLAEVLEGRDGLERGWTDGRDLGLVSMWDWARAEREALVVQLVCLPSDNDPLLLLADTRVLPEWGAGLRLLPIAAVLRGFLCCRLRIWDELHREQPVLTEEDERDVGVFLHCILLLHTGFDLSTLAPVTPHARLIGTTSLFKEVLSLVAETAQMLRLDFLPPPSSLISGRLLAHISRDTVAARELIAQHLSPEVGLVIERLFAAAKFPFLRPRVVEPSFAGSNVLRGSDQARVGRDEGEGGRVEVRVEEEDAAPEGTRAEQRRVLRATHAPVADPGSTSAAPQMDFAVLSRSGLEAPENVAAAPSTPIAIGGGSESAEAPPTFSAARSPPSLPVRGAASRDPTPLVIACAECGFVRDGAVDRVSPTPLTLNPRS